jgi:hypothetical protein
MFFIKVKKEQLHIKKKNSKEKKMMEPNQS